MGFKRPLKLSSPFYILIQIRPMQVPLSLLKGSERQVVHTARCWVLSIVQYTSNAVTESISQLSSVGTCPNPFHLPVWKPQSQSQKGALVLVAEKKNKIRQETFPGSGRKESPWAEGLLGRDQELSVRNLCPVVWTHWWRG